MTPSRPTTTPDETFGEFYSRRIVETSRHHDQPITRTEAMAEWCSDLTDLDRQDPA